MTQLLEKKDTTLVVEPPVGVKKRIGRIVAVAALIGVLGGWLAFEVASNQAETRRMEAMVAHSQAMDRFYQGQVEAERLERMIAHSQAMDEFYQGQVEAERLERMIAHSQAMDRFYQGQVEAERLESLIARSVAMDEFYGADE
jgi:heme oxygenase